MREAPGRGRRWTLALLLTAAFVATYPVYPLYHANQHTYFLHGLADAGYGHLADDWLAGTADPFPVFSALVRATAGVWEGLFHLHYVAILSLYFWVVVELAAGARGLKRWGEGYLVLAFLVMSLHSGVADYVGWHLTGGDPLSTLESGVAEQYLLGPVLQPSVFGVFLLLGILLHVRGRSRWAVVALGVAATVHPGYLLVAALLTAAFMLDLGLRGEGWRKPVSVGALALAVVLPIVVWTWIRFRPESPSTGTAARRILVHERLPHHALPVEWLDLGAVVGVGVVVGAVVVTRARPLGRVIATVLGGAVVLTLAQVATSSDRLALLFPWRASAALVPLSSAILLAFVVERVARRRAAREEGVRRGMAVGMGSLCVLAVVAGVLLLEVRVRWRWPPPKPALTAFVREHAEAGDLYLVPEDFPDFRLETGTPILVDWKSHPYRDVEVLEWWDRLTTARRFYAAEPAARCPLLEELQDEGVTHVVLPEGEALDCPGADRVYDGAHFAVVLLAGEGEGVRPAGEAGSRSGA